MIIIRKMSGGSDAPAPRFATHQSCHPHSCHLKEVNIMMMVVMVVMVPFPQTGLKIRKPDTEESSTAMASVIVIFLLLIVLLFIVLIIMYGDSKIT